MEQLLPEEQQRRLVIAIDYGTTFTGVAWATPARNTAKLHEIGAVQDWGDRMGNLDKVPSVISYSKSENGEQQWGSDLSRHAIAMVHTKLQLEVGRTSDELDFCQQALEGMQNLNFHYIENTESMPYSRYTSKTPEQIVEDYLRRVLDCVLNSLSILTSALIRHIPVDLVVTIPADYGYRAKNSTFRALTGAGFNKAIFPQLRSMLLVSEPEAAAIYTARYLKEQSSSDSLELGETFVLVDAGGATVELISYKVKKLEPYFEIEPVGVAIGAKCGSIFINLAFKKWLRDLIGPHLYQLLDSGLPSHKIGSYADAEGGLMREIMKYFEEKKRRFAKGSRDVYMDLPLVKPFDNLTIPDHILEGQITIPYAVMESFFEPSTEQIIRMIYDQSRDIEYSGTSLKNVFLVGGFAESPYLQAMVQEYLKLLPCRVELRIPDTSWTAVVRGAAIFGIEKASHSSVPTMSACPRSYGVTFDAVPDLSTNAFIAQDQLTWLMKKGELILSNEFKETTVGPLRMNFTRTGSKKGSFTIYAYDDEDLPENLARVWNEVGLTRIHVLEYDLAGVPLEEYEIQKTAGRVPLCTASFTLTMRIAPGLLRVNLWLKKRLIAALNIIDPQLEDIKTLPLDSLDETTSVNPTHPYLTVKDVHVQKAAADIVAMASKPADLRQPGPPVESVLKEKAIEDLSATNLPTLPLETSPFTPESSKPPYKAGQLSIHDRYKRCMSQYQSLSGALKNSTTITAYHVGFDLETSSSLVEDAYVRFRAWATNIAAIHQPQLQSSLDSRLNEAVDIRQRILKILGDLEVSLETGKLKNLNVIAALTSEALLIVTGLKPNERWQVGSISDSEEEEEGAANNGCETSELVDLFSAIDAANDSLMKLSIIIRRSPVRDDYLKAASRIPFDSTWDIAHVKEKHGASNRKEDWLLERLGRSITRRRQYLRYRQEHHLKLSQDWKDVVKDDAATSVIRTVAHTKATTVGEAQIASEQRSPEFEGSAGSQTSYEPTVMGAAVTLERLQVPPPPREAFDAVIFEYGKPFQCPYCCTEQIVKNRTSWKSHVFHDLKPYVCTFKECDLRMFSSRNEWFAHEMQNHRREWVCSSCPKTFHSRKSFQNHIVSIHGSSATGTEMEALILRSEEPVDRIAASACMLCNHLETSLLSPDKDAKRSFLNKGEELEPYVSPKQFRRHLGNHMEQLALFALPRNEIEDTKENDITPEALEEDQNEEMDDYSGSESSVKDAGKMENQVLASITEGDLSQPKPATAFIPGLHATEQISEEEPVAIEAAHNMVGKNSPEKSVLVSAKGKRGLSFKIRNPLKRWTGSKGYSTIAAPEPPIYQVCASDIRELTDLIRLRYALDIRIWANRQQRRVNEPIVEKDMLRADAVLRKIIYTVNTWDTLDVWTSSADWQRLRDIRERLESPGKRVWTDQPPWEKETDGSGF